MEDNIFITETGLTLRLRPVKETTVGIALDKLEREWRAKGNVPDAPTYTDPVGDVHPHEFGEGKNTLDVEDEAQSKANHAAWDAYQSALARLDEAKTQRRIEVYLALGVADFEIPDNGWREDLEWAGVDVSQIPTEPRALKAYYLQATLGTAELQLLMAEIAAITNVPPDQRELFRQALRNQMGNAIRAYIDQSASPASEAEATGLGNREPALGGT